MLYTGNTISAEEAHRASLINKVVPPEKLMDEARALADRIRDKSRMALRMAKMLVRGALGLNLGTGLAFEKEFVTFLSRSREAREGFKAFVERRKPRSGKE
jgi:enoyl-CoA hydratase